MQLKHVKISKKFKRKFIEISKLFDLYYFVYININEFENTTHKYTQDIKQTPFTVIFINDKSIAYYKDQIKMN